MNENDLSGLETILVKLVRHLQDNSEVVRMITSEKQVQTFLSQLDSAAMFMAFVHYMKSNPQMVSQATDDEGINQLLIGFNQFIEEATAKIPEKLKQISDALN